MLTPDDWLLKFQNLKVDRQKGKDNPAPHKPLLLLVVLELVEEGLLTGEVLELRPEMVARFCTFWSIVAYRRSQPPDLRLPFHHLQSDGLWDALDAEMKPAAGPPQTKYVKFEATFLTAILTKAWRDRARRGLIAPRYFPAPEERVALRTMLGLRETAEEGQTKELPSEAAEKGRKKGREAAFRLRVLAAYDYTCALTGYRLLTLSTVTIVDAAHIHQFAKSQNNAVRNGLALCKNAHWLFDNGLWTVAEDNKTVLVASEHFAEQHPHNLGLGFYKDQELRFPLDPALQPDPVHLAWHREHKYLPSRERAWRP
jgi:putative restriction endonuclease